MPYKLILYNIYMYIYMYIWWNIQNYIYFCMCLYMCVCVYLYVYLVIMVKQLGHFWNACRQNKVYWKSQNYFCLWQVSNYLPLPLMSNPFGIADCCFGTILISTPHSI